jgi:hypothetical protein
MNAWLLIDAHNVIHADAELRRLMHDPERARAELERLLAGRRCTTLFYDGGPDGAARSLRRKGLTVVYSGSDEADDAIVRWLKLHPGTRSVVVSDDAELGRRCRQLKAILRDTGSFLAGLRRQADAPIAQPPLPAHEVDFWMREFRVGR